MAEEAPVEVEAVAAHGQGLDDEGVGEGEGQADDNSSDGEGSAEGSEHDGSDYEGSDDSGVWSLTCAKCSGHITRRGQRVRLIADGVTTMYSTDLVTVTMEDRGRLRSHEACGCEIRDIFCSHCHTPLGYHVLEPCADCREGGNNGQYYMFRPDAVLGERRALESRRRMQDSPADPWRTQWVEWRHLPAFGERPPHLCAEDVAFVSPPDEELICAVCFDVLWEPLTLPCGHTFCRVCASRAVDLQRCCPMDRAPAKHTQLRRAPAALRGRIDQIPCLCRHGTRRDAQGVRERRPGGCSEVLGFGLASRRLKHEETCSFGAEERAEREAHIEAAKAQALELVQQAQVSCQLTEWSEPMIALVAIGRFAEAAAEAEPANAERRAALEGQMSHLETELQAAVRVRNQALFLLRGEDGDEGGALEVSSVLRRERNQMEYRLEALDEYREAVSAADDGSSDEGEDAAGMDVVEDNA